MVLNSSKSELSPAGEGISLADSLTRDFTSSSISSLERPVGTSSLAGVSSGADSTAGSAFGSITGRGSFFGSMVGGSSSFDSIVGGSSSFDSMVGGSSSSIGTGSIVFFGTFGKGIGIISIAFGWPSGSRTSS